MVCDKNECYFYLGIIAIVIVLTIIIVTILKCRNRLFKHRNYVVEIKPINLDKLDLYISHINTN